MIEGQRRRWNLFFCFYLQLCIFESIYWFKPLFNQNWCRLFCKCDKTIEKKNNNNKKIFSYSVISRHTHIYWLFLCKCIYYLFIYFYFMYIKHVFVLVWHHFHCARLYFSFRFNFNFDCCYCCSTNWNAFNVTFKILNMHAAIGRRDDCNAMRLDCINIQDLKSFLTYMYMCALCKLYLSQSHLCNFLIFF